MSNVISIAKAKEPRIWICNCGCSTFELMDTGEAVCAACGGDHQIDGAGWSSWKSESHIDQAATFRDIQGNGSVEFARRSIAAMAQNDDAALIVVITRDGAIKAWSEAETSKQIAYVQRKLRTVAGMFKRKGRD